MPELTGFIILLNKLKPKTEKNDTKAQSSSLYFVARCRYRRLPKGHPDFAEHIKAI
jgi:hypothetical protein